MVLAIVVAVFCCPRPDALADDLVRNGLFWEGTAGLPTGWQHEAFLSTGDAVKFEWIVEPSRVGVLKISNFKRNDSRWFQVFPVSPSTWYRVSGWIRTENVGTDAIGAYIVDMSTNYSSDDLHGSNNWRQVEFWMKTGRSQTSAEVACRVGGYSWMNYGTAYFAGISFVETRRPPYFSQRVFGASYWDFPGEHIISLVAVSAALLIALLLLRFVVFASRVQS